MVTPYRIAVAATGTQIKGKGKQQRTVTTHYAYMGWTADQSAEPHRLQGSGTFMYLGGLRVVAAARKYLALPETTQVQIRTNQDRKVLVYHKHADGRVTCRATIDD